MTGTNSGWQLWSVYIQCFFVTVATVLGTGILGLPVKLSNSGFAPFSVTFLLCLGIQVLIVYFLTDILQRCQARLDEQYGAFSINGREAIPLMEEDSDDLLDDLDHPSVLPSCGAVESNTSGPTPKSACDRQAPSLSLLSRFFLPKWLTHSFDFLILFSFIAIMITYCLAAGKEYAALLHLNERVAMLCFGGGLGLFVIFAFNIVQPVISLLTFFKGSVLIAVVAVTLIVGARAHVQVHDNFAYVLEPILIGALALSGSVNVMPMLFGRIPQRDCAGQVRGFRCSILLGIIFCFALNVCWAWAVLNIVPQRCDALQSNATCITSLKRAETRGEPSTIPLEQIILSDHPHFSWVALFVQIFIIVSISVCYLTHVAAFFHTIAGLVVYWSRSRRKSLTYPCFRSLTWERFWVYVASISGLTVIVFTALLKPDGFIFVLERVGSLMLNLECGPYFFIMIVMSKTGENRSLSIPLPLPKWIDYTAPLVLLFGLFSVAFDAYGFVLSLVHPNLQASNDSSQGNVTAV